MKKEVANKQTKDNNLGVLSVVFGILSVVLALLSPLTIPSMVFAIIGLIFASKQKKISPNKWSRWGRNLSIIGIIVALLSIVFGLWLIKNYPELFPQLAQ